MLNFSEWQYNRRKLMAVQEGTAGGNSSAADQLAESTSDLVGFGSSKVGGGGLPFGQIAAVGRGMFDLAANAMGKEQNDTMDSIYDSASDFASNFGPWGLLASGIIDSWNFIDKALGKKTTGFKGNTGTSGYQDFTVQDKQYRMTQGGAWKTGEKWKQAQLAQFSKAAKNAQESKMWDKASGQATDNRYKSSKKRLFGDVESAALVAKNGSKLDFIKAYIEQRSKIQTFAEGGAVIPSGSLHARKHHLGDKIPELEGNITNKGIPVITNDEQGIVQHAEIEKEEVILDLTLTKQLEKLWKDGSDEAKIEAGKILTEALLTNTEDNTGLIQKIAENENKG